MKASSYLDRLAVCSAISASGERVSDYAIANHFGVSHQLISHYRQNNRHFGDGFAIRVATALGMSPAAVLVDVAAERSKSPAAKKIWRALAIKLSETVTPSGQEEE